MSSPAFRVMYVSDRTTFADHHTFTTPDDLFTAGLGGFLARVARVTHPTGITVLLAGDAHRHLGFPVRPPRVPKPGEHPVLDSARAAGWEVDRMLVGPWMTFRRASAPRVHIGVMPWLSARTHALWSDSTDLLVRRHFLFHHHVGIPYYGAHAGLVGVQMMRDGHRGSVPKWRPDNWAEIPPAGTSAETATTAWSGPDHPMPYEHGLDARLQYLGAAGNAVLAVDQLRHDPRPEITNRNMPGWYEITVPPWQFDVIPHPVGRHPVGERAWIAAPTLDLLVDLAREDQVLAEPTVHQAWTGRGARILRGWATHVRGAIDGASTRGDDVLTAAVKGVYKQGIGLLKTPTGRIYRPDWQHTIISLGRSLLWRKMWGEGRRAHRGEHGQGGGRWPAAIDHDAVWYPSDKADHADDWPRVWFPRGTGPGQFDSAGTRAMPGVRA